MTKTHLREPEIYMSDMDVFDLITKGKALLAADAKRKAAERTSEQMESIQKRHAAASQRMRERFQYEPVAAVTLFEVQTCRNCGLVHHLFRGFGTRMARKADNYKVIYKADCLDRGLPHEREDLVGSSECCIDCIADYTKPAVYEPLEFVPAHRPEA